MGATCPFGQSAPSGLVADGTTCAAYYSSFRSSAHRLKLIRNRTETRRAFHQLDPAEGTGYLKFDVTDALPAFLQPENLNKLPWPEKGTFVFGGDRTVPHYVDIDKAQKEFEAWAGKENVARLGGFGEAMLRFVYDELPQVERNIMRQRQVGLTIDLAEVRVCESTGCSVHIDWYPREGMVMIIPLDGNPTQFFHPNFVQRHDQVAKRVEASLISAYGRWANFHEVGWEGKPSPGFRDNGQGVNVPYSVAQYLGTRAKDIPPAFYPNVPGVLPTVHKAGEGPRKVIVLNFSYRPLKTIPTPYMDVGPNEGGSSDSNGLRSSADAGGGPTISGNEGSP